MGRLYDLLWFWITAIFQLYQRPEMNDVFRDIVKSMECFAQDKQ